MNAKDKIGRDITAQKEELKTPLTSAKAYTQLLTEKYQDSNDIFPKNALSKVEGQVNNGKVGGEYYKPVEDRV